MRGYGCTITYLDAYFDGEVKNHSAENRDTSQPFPESLEQKAINLMTNITEYSINEKIVHTKRKECGDTSKK